jgi:hypothetical protein
MKLLASFGGLISFELLNHFPPLRTTDWNGPGRLRSSGSAPGGFASVPSFGWITSTRLEFAENGRNAPIGFSVTHDPGKGLRKALPTGTAGSAAARLKPQSRD